MLSVGVACNHPASHISQAYSPLGAHICELSNTVEPTEGEREVISEENKKSRPAIESLAGSLLA